MKKFIITLICLLFIVIGLALTYLSVKGYETDKFNTLISKEVKKIDQNLIINLDKIKIKLDIGKLNLFLSTKKPKVAYRDTNILINNLKIYANLSELLKSKAYISRAVVDLEELSVNDIQKLIVGNKPSNIKSLVLNNFSNGSIKSILDLNFEKNLKLINYKIDGRLINSDIKFSKKYQINSTELDFSIDQDLVSMNKIKTNYKGIPINDGEIKIIKKDNYEIDGSLNLIISTNENKIKEIFPSLVDNKILEDDIKINGSLLSNFNINLDESLKVLKYNLNLEGKIDNSIIGFKNELQNSLIKEGIKQLLIKKSNFKLDLNQEKKNKFIFEGLYKTNNNNYQNFKINNNFNQKLSRFEINFNLIDEIVIKFINYDKDNLKIANINAELIISNKEIKIKNLKYQENKNIIFLNNFILNKELQIKRFNELRIKTYKNKIQNNNFNIKYAKKILVSGSDFDSTNIINQIKNTKKNNILNKISKDLEISISNVSGKYSNNIKNFKLIGKIEKGKITKLSSKSEFSENKYLDISLKKSTTSNQNIFELYSDLPKIILDDYSVFEGIEGGKLLFISEFDDFQSSSSLTIENFKVLKAPAFAKLLSLADFRGMVDLLSGEGISFDILEINLFDDKKVLKINEVIAIGPSISILMEGYVENTNGLTSLRGTMIPAKTLNTLISKIPLLGDILIPKDIGEGLFGISFKIKGLPQQMKTSVNPIKTLTPRFITKILDRKKNN